MPDAAHGSPAPFQVCTGCGSWCQQPPCPACGWPVIAAPTLGSAAPEPLRLLADLVLDHTGRVRPIRVSSRRLAWLARQPSWLDLSGESLRPGNEDLGFCLATLRSAVRAKTPGRLDAGLWERFRGSLRAMAAARVAERNPSWRGDAASDQPVVDLALRVFVHVPDFDLPAEPTPAVRVTAFVRAMATEGARLVSTDLEPDLSPLALAPDARRSSAAIRLSTRRDALLRATRYILSTPSPAAAPGAPAKQPVAGLDQFHFCPAGVAQTLQFPDLPVPDLHRISSALGGGSSLEAVLEFEGAPAPFSLGIPPSALTPLPAPEAQVDLFLDIGSTQTKYCIHLLAKKSLRRNVLGTALATAQFLLPPFHKEALIERPDNLRSWLADAIPALVGYAHEKDGAFIRNVSLGFPSFKGFSPGSLAAALQPAARRWLLGEVRIVPEHELLALRYLPVVAGLKAAAERYRDEVTRNEATREQVVRRNLDLARQKEEYEKRNWFSKLFASNPGKRKFDDLPPKMSAPERWMLRLVEQPATLDRHVLLDAGGFSLDVTLVERGQVLSAESGSHPDVGGETLSRMLALGSEADQSEQMTTYKKARLGRTYRASPTLALEDARIRAYRDQTGALYAAPLATVFDACARRWSGTPFLVVLVGGGSLNPFLGEVIDAAMAARGLLGERVSPLQLSEYIAAGRALALELDDDATTRFLTTMGWADDRLQKDLNYDPYALVAAMLNRGS